MNSQSSPKHTNSLIKESSPYLRQHAHNPVNWVPWSEDVFEKAKKENKLVLISSGYSSCHWCHVMEKECFEDEDVANLMNTDFICVKVDREERPDVDNIYMTALQLMTQRGGWPLNCITLPDGRPIYGGTYFPKDQWIHVLTSIEQLVRKDLKKVLAYAQNIHLGISQSELIDNAIEVKKFSEEEVHEMVIRWSKKFDTINGGTLPAPKFPLPNNYEFLLAYGVLYKNEKILHHVELTLDKMAMGGLYDQIGGGFTRYSVDFLWKVPHFEKMLYDNAQLLSLYSKAYTYFKKPLYKRVVYQTIEWVDREMFHHEGSYYSALDADSEGEEGKFYCWGEYEFDNVLGDDALWVKDFYNLNQNGYWEEGKYIPLITEKDDFFTQKYGWSTNDLGENIAKINKKLLFYRNNRVRPSLDDKSITAWNALLIKGLCFSYRAFDEEKFKQKAIAIAKWICDYQLSDGGTLLRIRKNGESKIDGFLEDYACTVEAFITLYEITFEKIWLEKAVLLLHFTLENFQHPVSSFFYFTPQTSTLIARKMELHDNVVPASNSIMAQNLWKLGHLFQRHEWKQLSEQLLSGVYERMPMYGSGYSNWGLLLLNYLKPSYQLVITGQESHRMRKQLQSWYFPNTLYAGGGANLPILGNKTSDETVVFVCSQDSCLSPTSDADDVRKIVLK